MLATEKTAYDVPKHVRDVLTSDGYILLQTPVHILKTGLRIVSFQYCSLYECRSIYFYTVALRAIAARHN
jgi:hypothetical protein